MEDLTLDDLRREFDVPDMSDSEIIRRVSKISKVPELDVADYFGMKIDEPGFVSAVQRSYGATAKGLGELTGIGPIRRWGEDVEFANPPGIQGFSDIMESPWLALREAAGTAVGYGSQMLGPGGLGAAAVRGGGALAAAGAPTLGRAAAAFGRGLAGAPGQTAAAALPSYGQIKETQRATGTDDEWWSELAALAGAGTVGLIETKFGLNPEISRAIAGATTPAAKLAALQAARMAVYGSTPARTFGKTALKVVGGEAGEEIPQTFVERAAGGQAPFSEEGIGEAAFGATMGALGALPFGLGMGGYRALNQPLGAATGTEPLPPINPPTPPPSPDFVGPPLPPVPTGPDFVGPPVPPPPIGPDFVGPPAPPVPAGQDFVGPPLPPLPAGPDFVGPPVPPPELTLTDAAPFVDKTVLVTTNDGVSWLESTTDEERAPNETVVMVDRNVLMPSDETNKLAMEMGIAQDELALLLSSSTYDPTLRQALLDKARGKGYLGITFASPDVASGGMIFSTTGNFADLAPKVPTSTVQDDVLPPVPPEQLGLDLQPPPVAVPPSAAISVDTVIQNMKQFYQQKLAELTAKLTARGKTQLPPVQTSFPLPPKKQKNDVGLVHGAVSHAEYKSSMDQYDIQGNELPQDKGAIVYALDKALEQGQQSGKIKYQYNNIYEVPGLGTYLSNTPYWTEEGVRAALVAGRRKGITPYLKLPTITFRPTGGQAAAVLKPGTIATQGWFKYRNMVEENKRLGIPSSADTLNRARWEAHWYKAMMPVIQDLFNKYTPDGKLVVKPDWVEGGGWFLPLGGGAGMISIGVPYSSYLLAHSSKIKSGPNGDYLGADLTVAKNELAQTKAKVFTTTVHEGFGHYLMAHTFEQQPAEVQAAVVNEYLQWLDKMTKPGVTWGEMLESAGLYMKGYGWFKSEYGKKVGATVAGHGPDYWLNFDEYVARRVSDLLQKRLLEKDLDVRGLPFWRSIGAKLKQFFHDAYKKWMWKDSSLEIFLDRLSVANRLKYLDTKFANGLVNPEAIPDSPTNPSHQAAQDLIALSVAPASNAFKDWFRESKVVDSRGDPLVLYHGTNADADFDVFISGSHFGTKTQADTRINTQPGIDWDSTTPPSRIMPVYLSIQNPLPVDDADYDAAGSTRHVLRSAGMSNYEGWNDPRFWAYSIYKKTGRHEGWTPSDLLSINASTFAEKFEALVNSGLGQYYLRPQEAIGKILREDYGFDGASYINAFEGYGKSWIAFTPRQVKSATGNDGSFSRTNPSILYSVAPPVPSPTRTFDSLNRAFGTKLTSGELGKNQARFNWFMKHMLTLPQIERENWTIPGVRGFVDAARRWWGTKGQWVARFDTWVDDVRRSGYGKAELTKLWRFANEVTVRSDELGRKLTPVELAEEARKVGGLDDGLLALWRNGRQVLQDALDKLEQLAEGRINGIWNPRIAQQKDVATRITMTEARDEALKKNREDFRLMRNRDYWPLSRFGEFTVHVVAEQDMAYMGKNFKKGQTILFELYETQKEQQARKLALGRAYGAAVKVAAGKVDESLYSFLGLPPSVLKMIEGELIDAAEEYITGDEATDKETRDLLNKQLDALRTVMLHFTPENAFKQRLLRRKGTRGFTDDGLRAMASLGQSLAGHIARAEHRGEMDESLKVLDQHRRAVEFSTDPALATEGNKLGDLLNYLRQSQKDMMNPGEDLANLRAAGFLWYLGAVPRAALIQVAQPFFTTYPWLSHRYGDGRAVAEMAKGYTLLRKMFKNQAGMLDPHLEKAIADGIRAGFLNQSLFTELAGIAEGSNLQRLLPGKFFKSQDAASLIRKAGYYASWMFQKGEEVNRLVTFRAAYMLELKKLLGMEGGTDAEVAAKMRQLAGTPEGVEVQDLAFRAGRTAVEGTQGEYARWARPQLMRGKKSAIFLFKMYTQIMSYFAFRDPGAWRFWAIQLAIAGALGLPFAGDAEELLNVILLKLGWTKKDLEQYAREYVAELGMNPELAMHGLARWATPWDLSASMSLGHIIPGVEPLASAMIPGGSLSNSALRLQQEALGALFSIPLNWTKAVSSGEERDIEAALPTVVRDVYRTYRRAREGGERGRGGEMMADIDWSDPLDVVTHLGQAAGFRPKEIAVAQERQWAKTEVERYWSGRREAVVGQFYHLFKTGQAADREALADVMEAVRKFNAEAPYPELAINSKQLRQGLKESLRRQGLKEEGQPAAKKYRRLYSEIDMGFAPAP